MFRRLVLIVALAFAVLAVNAPSSPLSAPVHAAPATAPAVAHAALFDKTRVILHLAIAFGVFHHWVYKPWKSANLSIHHPIYLIKAGAALLFAVHEVKVSYDITGKSNSGTLKALHGVLGAVVTKFTSVGNLFHSNPSTLTDAQVGSSVTDLNGVVNQSNGILNVPDANILPAIPGVS